MKITVIGHLCLDVIQRADTPGQEAGSYGGIFFSVAALANLLPEDDTICPAFGVGNGEYDDLIERLKRYPNVDTSGIYPFPGPTNRVRLVYTDAAERIECSRDIGVNKP